MRNIVTYMAEEQRTFAESPFNPVDSLVFSTLAYFNYETAPPIDLSSPEGILLHDAGVVGQLGQAFASDWSAANSGH